MRNHIPDQIEAYLAESLSYRQQRLLEQHVETCRPCQSALKEAQAARAYLHWLTPCEPPPQPGPAFYYRVRESIDRKQTVGWFQNWAAALHPHLAYPLASLIVLLIAWTLTYPRQESEEVLLAMDLPSSEFVSLSSSDTDSSLGRDLVMRSLVEVPDNDFVGETKHIEYYQGAD